MEAILSATRVRLRQESVRRDGSEGGSEEGARKSMIMVVTGSIGVLVWRQMTPRWADDPVQRHIGGGGVGAGGGCPLRKEIRNWE